MNYEKHVKKTKHRFFLWVSSYVAFGVCSNVYVIYQQYVKGNNPIRLLSGFQLITLGAVSLYFIPFLIVIYRNAKQFEMKRMYNILKILLLIFCIWDVLLLIFTVMAIIYPNFVT